MLENYDITKPTQRDLVIRIIFPLLKVVDRVSETQLQVGENRVTIV